MLKLFKSDNPIIVATLLLLTLLFLWWNVFFGNQTTELFFPFDISPMPFYNYISGMLPAAVTKALAIVLQLITAFIIARITVLNQLIDEKGFLYLFFYFFIVNSYFPLQRFQPVLVAGIFILLSFQILYSTFKNREAIEKLFFSGMYIAMASFFYFQSIYFIVAILIGCSIIRPFNWREWTSAIVGATVPYLFLYSIVFLTVGNIAELTIQIRGGWNMELFEPTYNLHQYIFFFSLAFFTFIAIFFLLSYDTIKIKQRKIYFSLLVFLAFCVGIFFLLPSVSIELLYFVAFPISIILSRFFTKIKNKKMREIFFILFFISLLFNQFKILDLFFN